MEEEKQLDNLNEEEERGEEEAPDKEEEGSSEESQEDKSDSEMSLEEKNKILFSVLQDIRESLDSAMLLLGGEIAGKAKRKVTEEENKNAAKVIEGVFAGDKMVGSDGIQYDIPANYASKSRLVEGDILKLTITAGGNMVYKQIGPIARRRMMGELVVDDETGETLVVSDDNKWKILRASVTYYKGVSGDKVAFMVPEEGPSRWAAVENIIRTGENYEI